MSPETETHLRQVEAAVREAARLLAIHTYADDLRTVLTAGFLAQVIEHHEAILLLIRGGKVGSSFALARALVEGTYRGLWVNRAASDTELARLERRDEVGAGMTEIARAIDTVYQTGEFFRDLKTRSWDALNSYAHTGVLQLGRRFQGHNLVPDYSDAEIYELTTTATTCVLLLARWFLAVHQHPGESCAVDALMETYGEPARRAAQPPTHRLGPP